MSKRRKRNSPEQIVKKLRHGEATWNRWRNQYGGMKPEEVRRLSALEDENRRLKHLVADLPLDNHMLKHEASQNW